MEYALTIEGFRQEFPDRMSFAPTPVNLIRAKVPINVKLPIPIKLYKLQQTEGQKGEKSGEVSCVVLWINREWLGDKPLEVIKQIVEDAVFGDKDGGINNDEDGNVETDNDAKKPNRRDQIQVSVIGPNYSEDLQKIVNNVTTTDHGSELQKWCADNNLRLLSHSATFYKRKELERLRFRRAVEAEPGARARRRAWAQAADVVVINTIGTNSQLVGVLVDELRKRWLLSETALIFVESGATSPAELKLAFSAQRKQHAGNTQVLEGKGALQLIEVPFMRGIGGADGRLSTGDVGKVTDYLVRTMEGRVAPETNREQIKAVGVFANFTDDKLAILRVAKPMFPNATFFTVDMDARYAEPANLPFTRNLLIASHFGLEIEMSSPLLATDQTTTRSKPLKFRDTYQTSRFLTARLTQQVFLGRACPTRLQSMWIPTQPPENSLSPLVFEIGNNGAYQYPAESTALSGPGKDIVGYFARMIGLR